MSVVPFPIMVWRDGSGRRCSRTSCCRAISSPSARTLLLLHTCIPSHLLIHFYWDQLTHNKEKQISQPTSCSFAAPVTPTRPCSPASRPAARCSQSRSSSSAARTRWMQMGSSRMSCSLGRSFCRLPRPLPPLHPLTPRQKQQRPRQRKEQGNEKEREREKEQRQRQRPSQLHAGCLGFVLCTASGTSGGQLVRTVINSTERVSANNLESFSSSASPSSSPSPAA